VSSWRCPYCNQIATLLDSNMSRDTHKFNRDNKDGNLALGTTVIVCPNSKCRQYTIDASLQSYEVRAGGSSVLVGDVLASWRMKPDSAARPLPDYIPQAIQNDYREACLIVGLSPKASATLSRRCLQGMLRDFHGIKGKTLFAEIQELEDKIDHTTWEAIDSLRSIGNIGAHMEAEINVIVDVDPDEASLLIELIETLIEDWYIQRHERAQRMSKIIAVASEKKAEQNAGGKTVKVPTPESGK
jgi:hypothetical protein